MLLINTEPEKGNYLPVHTSDRAVYQRCPRRWYFSSPMHLNLQPRRSVIGIAQALEFGTLVHTALEQYYNPVLSRDPVETFRTEWYNHFRELEAVIPGLEFMEWWPEWEAHRDLGIGMLTYYAKWAKENDNFRVVNVEHDFYVPLNLEHRGLPVYYKGRMDAVVQDLDTERYFIIDHKTAGRVDDAFWGKLETDEQVTSYAWAAELEAEHYDLEYKEIAGVYYNVLPKKFPQPPDYVYKGKAVSLDRQNQCTTPELFMRAVEIAGLQDWYYSNDKARSYYEWLQSDENQFVFRRDVRRNRHQITNAGDRINRQVVKMLAEEDFDPHFSGEWFCVHCPFRAPCLQMEDGSDPILTLETNYEDNTDRNPNVPAKSLL